MLPRPRRQHADRVLVHWHSKQDSISQNAWLSALPWIWEAIPSRHSVGRLRKLTGFSVSRQTEC